MLHIPLTLYLLLIKILGIIALFWGTNSTFAAVTKTNYHYLTMVVFSEDHIQETRRRGRIEVICGSMFSGKTEELIRRLKRAMTATPLPPPLLILPPVSYYSLQIKM